MTVFAFNKRLRLLPPNLLRQSSHYTNWVALVGYTMMHIFLAFLCY